MHERDFAFCFKASRDYVHGTDMYNLMAPWLQEAMGVPLQQPIKEIDLAIHKIVRHGLTGSIQPVDAPAPPATAVAIRFVVAGVRHKAHFVENASAVDCRYDYDEDAIAVGAAIDAAARTLNIRNVSAYSPIEVLVALNKQLVLRTMEGPGKWYFTRLVIPRPLPAVADADITLQITAVMGTRMTRTALTVNGTSAGEMYFSKVAPA